jgi:Na+/proline symporter
MMSTADSALLAFSSMWVKDLFVPYIRPQATQQQQIWFGRAMSVLGLGIGVSLGECGCPRDRVGPLPEE